MPVPFVPECALDGLPNVVVDGSANPSAVLTLSHWPGASTPSEVRDDLSAQIVFRALEHPNWFEGVSASTTNHFDQDGLCCLFTLARPELAVPRRSLVVDVARAGDFATFEERDGARIAMAIAAFDDPELSPLGSALATLEYPEMSARLYEHTLPLVAEMIDRPDRWRSLWDAEDAHLGESLDAIANGAVSIAEHREVDLAVFTVPFTWTPRPTHRFTQRGVHAVHPMAINSSTDCLRTLVVQDQRYQLECRYETWVMFASRPVRARPDLRDLVPVLDALEPGGVHWTASSPAALTPTLQPIDGTSDLAPDVVISTICDHLATAPAAWDPFAPR